ncbi:hypothetical protein F4677DRAFT_432447 [Hypoxylon crocopeplum]|nr:hypothetical protein F4677DRAFT_432447 [Hypoxylon crocopeplum]
MSKLVDDVKTGIKGIRGAGDALRGGVLEGTDQAFDNNSNHPETQAAQAKNRAVTEKGKQDVRNVDDMFARREWERKGVTGTPQAAPANQPATTTTTTTTGGPNAPAPTSTGHEV